MEICNIEKCFGCSACFASCPQSCIQMIRNSEGFFYPKVEDKKCVHCGKCEAICPANKLSKSNDEIVPKAYAVMANDLELRRASSSGGVFSLLAEHVLSEGGVVFGAAMTEDCKGVHHIMVENADNLATLRGSKYLQSNLENSFVLTREELVSGKKVLFSGTPCQIEGLKAFLGKEYENLLCVDLICHGTPSPKLWEKYIAYQENKHHAPIIKVNFRSKSHGWRFYGTRLENSNLKVLYSTLSENPYLQLFLKNYCLRPSCYQCHAKKLNRVSDITIADFWGVENVVPALDDNMGTSLVIIQSQKGQTCFEQIATLTKWQEVDCRAAIKYNPSMITSCNRPKERDTFFADLEVMSFPKLEKKYLPEQRRRISFRKLLHKGKVILWNIKKRLVG